MIDFSPSPVQKIDIEGFSLFLKRDDLLDPDFSGNKARKFYYFLKNDFPDINRVVSFGSNQSNAMYSLSVLCKLKGWEFEYFIDHINKNLLQNPKGNLKLALKNGMNLKLKKEWGYNFGFSNLTSETKTIRDTLFIPEGGRCETSYFGIEILAKEIIDFKKTKDIKKLHIFLPSGTGATALFLQKALKISNDISQVYTVACVGGKEYLKKEFFSLEDNPHFHPLILGDKKYHFGKLREEFYLLWKRLKEQNGVEFDLLYDPIGIKTMVKYLEKNPVKSVMYIHQGGIIGNESMADRYRRKYGKFR